MDLGDRYLVVSLGSIGRRHLSNLRKLRPGAEIGVLRLHTAVTDVQVAEGADWQSDSIEEALAFSPSAAIVAGPASMHLPVARRLADAGVHLLVEKPIADRDEGLADLIEACRHRRLALMVGYNLRFLPSLQYVKTCIEQGAIGRVFAVRAEVGQYLPDWRPGADYRQAVSARAELGGGVLLELSHELDYLYWFFGLPAQVTARGGRYSDLEVDAEDTVEVVLEYESPRRLVSVHLDMVQRAPCRQCRFVGSEGTLTWDGIADRIALFRVDTGWLESLDAPKIKDRNQMYLDELGHFLDCVHKGKTPLVDGQNGRDVLAIVEAARQSMASARTVRVLGGNVAD